MARTVHYGSNDPYTIMDDTLGVEDIKRVMSESFPELANATARVDGNNIYFEVKAGTKGMARTVHYGSNDPYTIMDDTLGVEDIKRVMSESFPELANATARVDGNNIYFEVKAGTKGMARTVHYGSNDPYTIMDDTLGVEDIKRVMSESFPELANATARVDGNNIYFEVKAGTKGMARTVHYGSNDPYTIMDDTLGVEDIKRVMSESFPELANATARVDGNNIYFEVKAGTKGMARTVHYASNDPYTIMDDTLGVEDIKRVMSESFPELANATARVDGNNIYFEVKAGTKGTRI